MKKLTVLIVFTAFASLANAQDGNSIRRIILSTRIIDTNGNKSEGYLHSVTDSGMYLMNFKKPVYSATDRSNLFSVDPQLIKSVTVKRKGQGGKGLAIGLLSGAIAGALIGRASYTEPGPEAWFDFGPALDAIGGAVIGSLLGGVVGASISSGAKKYKIDGRKESFRTMQLHIYKRLSKRGARNPLN